MIPYFDLQINGCFGVDFNSDELTVEQLQEVCCKLYARGTRQFLATLITADLSLMLNRVERLAKTIQSLGANSNSQPAAKCIGIHLEGPFLSSEAGYVGAHPAQYAIKASLLAAKQLHHAGQGLIKLVTLAPEQDSKGTVTKFFAQQRVVVSAGHTNATLEQLKTCVDNGLRMITHFGNACPTSLPRHDNILWRMLSLDSGLYLGIIADSHHLPLWSIPMLAKHFGNERIVCVSDAMSAAGLGQGTFQLGQNTIKIGADLVARDTVHGNFVGATSLLDTCATNLRSLDRFSELQLEQFLWKNAQSLLSRH
jgi:N-acetylglucosamine-6-phosphate deacetylase